MQALPTVRGEPRKGRTPAEEQLWLQLHNLYVAEAQQLAQKVLRDARVLPGCLRPFMQSTYPLHFQPRMR